MLVDVKQHKLDFFCTTSSGKCLQKLVAVYILEEMMHVSTVDSLSFGCVIEKIIYACVL